MDARGLHRGHLRLPRDPERQALQLELRRALRHVGCEQHSRKLLLGGGECPRQHRHLRSCEYVSLGTSVCTLLHPPEFTRMVLTLDDRSLKIYNAFTEGSP